MSFWNHRVIKKTHRSKFGDELIFQIVEAHYEDGVAVDAIPSGVTVDAITPQGDTLAELKWELEHMLKACEKPVLDGDKLFQEFGVNK